MPAGSAKKRLGQSATSGRKAVASSRSALRGLFGKAKLKAGPQMSEPEMRAFVLKHLRKKFGSQFTEADARRLLRKQ